MLTDAGAYLIHTLFNLYVYVIILRLLLQAVRIHFNNPLAQFAVKYTQPVVKHLQTVLPVVKRIDLAILLFALGVEIVMFLLLSLLNLGSFPNLAGIVLLSVGDLLRHFSTFYFYAILAQVVFSWLVLLRYTPVSFAVTQLTEPVLAPLRRLIPPIAGFDLSALIALILLHLFEILLVAPLMGVGSNLLGIG